MEFFWTLPLLLIYIIDQSYGRCERSVNLENGSTSYRLRNLIRFRCDRGFTLQGSPLHSCDRDGRVRGEKPYCARDGCVGIQQTENGVVISSGLSSEVMCRDTFVLVGNRVAYCDGEVWNTQLGTCRRSNYTGDHSCDFESDDQCGWEAEATFRRPWRRVSAVNDIHSLKTGPHHDHTFRSHSGGHYMRMETQSGAYGNYHFMSPIYPRSLSLKTACCFRFHYFMYGAGVGSLVVSVKPVSMRMTEMWNRFRANFSKFEVEGQQGTQWIEHTIAIDEMQEDFQVIFTATDARAQFGDIAIDDVKLMTGSDCGANGFTTSTEPPAPPTASSEMPLVWDMMSCTGRCGSTNFGSTFNDGHAILSCGCDDSCLLIDNCCLNYLDECVNGLDTTTDEEVSFTPTTTTTTTTTTPKPTTTTTTSTTTTTATPKPTTSTTTTPKPTTTTTTTPKPTTTSTTTTTQKPTTTTTTATTTKKPTTTTRKTTTSTTSTSTTPKTTTTKKVLTTEKTTKTTTPSTSSSPKIAGIGTATTPPQRKRITWKVDPQDIDGHTDTNENTPNPALIALYLLVGVVLVVVLGNITHRWLIPNGGTRPHNETTVTFKKAMQSLRKRRGHLRNRNTNNMEHPLCDTDNDDDDYFEETGVDIRNGSDL
uniref:MAM and LDL-receptor class A domain-containing protein 2-like n=1 Tax=Drosophila rhopaloa TaxID=1041015 RepID=A0A6P4FS55_DRORH